VRIRFIGDKNQREERLAYFDSRLGSWRAVLYSKQPGSYRAVLVRNGAESDVEAEEGIVELKRCDAGTLPVKQPQEGRWSLDTGDTWVGVGTTLGPANSVREVNALADAGANWLRIDPPGPESSAEWDDIMAAVERRGFYYTVRMPDNASPAWRRYFVARYAASPRLVQWDTKARLEDPWARGVSSAIPWDMLFENQRGPFFTVATDYPLLKALKTMIDVSDWARWRSPKAWKMKGAEGVADGDRMVLVVSSSARIEGAPLRDGTYDLTAIDRSTGGSVSGTTQIVHGAFVFKVADPAFLILRRRI